MPDVPSTPGGDAQASAISTTAELKRWVAGARRSSTLSPTELALQLGMSGAAYSRWEDPGDPSLPSLTELDRIRDVLGVALPHIAPDLQAHVSKSEAAEALTVAGEIDLIGQQIAAHCFRTESASRNATVFHDRYVLGRSLQELATSFGMSRQRVRQILDLMHQAVPSMRPPTPRFDDLVRACALDRHSVASTPPPEIAGLLGPRMTLGLASDFGWRVLGRQLPLDTGVGSLDMLIVRSGDTPWLPFAAEVAREQVQTYGAALVPLVQASVSEAAQEVVDARELAAELERVSGFKWLGTGLHWFWFGPGNSPNDLVKWVLEVVSVGSESMSVEELYGAFATGRGRTLQSGALSILPPMDVFLEILKATPGIVCLQDNQIRLSGRARAEPKRSAAEQQILDFLRSKEGIASRAEIEKACVIEKNANKISVGHALSQSPLFRRLDQTHYAIRGWPLRAYFSRPAGDCDAADRGAAQSRPIAWEFVLTEAGVANRSLTIPKETAALLKAGTYALPWGPEIVVHIDRGVGRVARLITELVGVGARPGDRYRLQLDVDTGRAQLTMLDRSKPAQP